MKKRKKGRLYKITKKDKNFFLSGLIAAAILGVIGAMLINSLFELISLSDSPNLIIWIIFILSLCVFFSILFWLNKQIEKN